MKVLIVATNQEPWPFPVAPHGAMAVAAAAEADGHEVDILDLMFARRPMRSLGLALRRSKYDAVGLSIRNLDNCFFAYPVSYFASVRQITSFIKEHTDVPLILGGSGFSVDPQGWMNRVDADFGIVGEGEIAFPVLLSHLMSHRTLEGCLGMARGNGGSLLAMAPGNLENFPIPLHEKCRYAPYLARGGFIGIQTKRGCPFECIYCTYPIIEGSRVRIRDPQSVIMEVERMVHKNGSKSYVYFTDGVFNSPREHALRVCRELIRTKLHIGWTAYCNPVGLDSELASAMAESGCIGIELGLDAATEKMLVALGKHFTLDDIRSSMDAIVTAGLPLSIHLLFGGPGETRADIIDTQKFLHDCVPADAIFAAMGVRIYRGTEMERVARREGVITNATDLFDPTFYVSPHLGHTPTELLDGIARKLPEWSTATDWYHPLLRLIQKVANRCGARPQWRNVRSYGRYMRQ